MHFKETRSPNAAGAVGGDQNRCLPDQVFEGIVDSFAPASGSEFSLLLRKTLPATSPRSCAVPVKIAFQQTAI